MKWKKILEKHKLPKLTQEEVYNLKTSLFIKEVEFVLQNIPTEITPDPDGFMDEFYQTLKDEKSNSILTFLENASKGNISQLAL